MIEPLSTALIWVAVGAALWALVLVLLNRPLPLDRRDGQLYLGLLGLLELGLLGQAVAGFVKLAGAEHEVAGLSFAGYLLGALLILPVAVFWSLAERTRWGTAVLVVGALVVPVMIVRLDQIWTAAGRG
ncbi:hypothetical protein [Actinokineospora iranica]|uniref:Integral membrane protein n=1 Tax=Actinokineospora iranica TaxID=1271860 RepID=A0A1G6MBT1_9PSEU|nr:hypothetical protein [Actinokineospora iranica]SDC53058.1 hypothetical protein SAMN05216174_102476 [Actinokineospora iranica]